MGIENLLTPEELADAKRVEDADNELERLEEIANEAEDDDSDDAAAEAKGDDEKGDDKEADGEKEGAEAKADDEGKGDDEDEDEDGDGRPEFQTTFAPTFDAGDPRAIDEQLKAVRDERAALKAKWRSGDIDDEEFDKSEALLDEQKDALIQQRAQAVTAASLSEASARQAFARDKTNFLATMTKYEGVPYSANAMLASSFEQELIAAAKQALDEKRDPSAQELFEAAHARVLEQLSALGVTVGKKRAPQGEAPQGEAPAKPAGKKAEAREPADRSGVPPTLGGVPAAAPNTTMEDDLIAQASQYEGEDLELFIAKLTPEKRRVLESAA